MDSGFPHFVGRWPLKKIGLRLRHLVIKSLKTTQRRRSSVSESTVLHFHGEQLMFFWAIHFPIL